MALMEQNAAVDNPEVECEDVNGHSSSKDGVAPKGKLFKGSSNSVYQQNVSELKRGGKAEDEAHRLAMAMRKGKTPPRHQGPAGATGEGGSGRHANLGGFLHPRKDGKPHGSMKNDPAID